MTERNGPIRFDPVQLAGVRDTSLHARFDLGGVTVGVCKNDGLLKDLDYAYPFKGVLYDDLLYRDGLEEVRTYDSDVANLTGVMGLMDATLIGRRNGAFASAFKQHDKFQSVSNVHALIHVDKKGLLVVEDLGSTNGTKKLGTKNSGNKGDESRYFKMTNDLKREIGNRYTYTSTIAERRNVEELEGLLRRHMIARDTRIDGGFYWSDAGDTATVVDWDGYRDKGLSEAETKLLKALRGGRDLSKKPEVLVAKVEAVVADVMPYRDSYVNDKEATLIQERMRYGVKPLPAKVSLTDYLAGKIKDSGGVCRHQCLLAGVLIERMIDRQQIGGAVSVDRNLVVGVGGHAWARYTDDEGRVFIADAAQHMSGELVQVSHGSFGVKTPRGLRYCDDGTGKGLSNRGLKRRLWPYQRPEDLGLPLLR